MIDTRALAQEVQDQLLAAMQRGQDQMRKSQEQMRKSREAVHDVIRTGNQLAKAVRPSMPTLPKPAVHVPSLSTLANPAKLRASAQELSEHVIATQRNLTDKAVQAATPVAEQFVAVGSGSWLPRLSRPPTRWPSSSSPGSGSWLPRLSRPPARWSPTVLPS